MTRDFNYHRERQLLQYQTVKNRWLSIPRAGRIAIIVAAAVVVCVIVFCILRCCCCRSSRRRRRRPESPPPPPRRKPDLEKTNDYNDANQKYNSKDDNYNQKPAVNYNNYNQKPAVNDNNYNRNQNYPGTNYNTATPEKKIIYVEKPAPEIIYVEKPAREIVYLQDQSAKPSNTYASAKKTEDKVYNHSQNSEPTQSNNKISSHTDNSKGYTSASDNKSTGYSEGSSGASPSPSPSLGFQKTVFTYEELEEATEGFAKGNMLGEGGFGCVYKGVLSSNGQAIAVKKLRVGAAQGDREFYAEVEIISRVHHRHLVSLVGFCMTESERILVYEFLPNGSLDRHLHGKTRIGLDWPTRMKIAIGSARGLTYLHEDCHPRIIHRDIKSSNILLDETFNAQVSDFGLAKLTPDALTHVTTRVVGTFGYLAPEYAFSGKVTYKSDVFSFGVMLLELVTGQKPVDPSKPQGQESLVDRTRPLLANMENEDDIMEIIDPIILDGYYNKKEIFRVLEVAAACVRHSAIKRPKMAQVSKALEDDDFVEVIKQGAKNEGPSYNDEMGKFYKVAFGSQDNTTSEYSGEASTNCDEESLPNLSNVSNMATGVPTLNYDATK